MTRRVEDVLRVGVAGLIATGIALAVAVETPKPNYLVLLGGAALGVAIVALIVNTRLEVSVAVLALYLGLLGGPVKLGIGGHEVGSAMRDVVIGAVSIGAIIRLLAKREPLRLPPLFGWVLAFVAIVAIQAFNPATDGFLHIVGGLRQQLEWVPFFFFGYLVMRSKGRFRRMFIILGVLAVANGAVATYQTRISPAALASWGPGYRELVFGGAEGLSARTYRNAEGESRARPPALGTDAGFGGGVGVLAVSGAVALFAMARGRRRWTALLLFLGALVAVVTGLGRIEVVGAVIAMITFALLSATSGGRMARPIIALVAILALALPFGVLFVSAEGSGTFNRYTSIAPENVSSVKDTKTSSLTHIPARIEAAPFGLGLGCCRAGRVACGKDRTRRPWGQRRDTVQFRERRTRRHRPGSVGHAVALRDRARRAQDETGHRSGDARLFRRRVRAFHRLHHHRLVRADDVRRRIRSVLLVLPRDRLVLVRRPQDTSRAPRETRRRIGHA